MRACTCLRFLHTSWLNTNAAGPTETQPAKAQLVKLGFFAGLTMPEAAAAMSVSLATAERYWTFAKSWLYAELTDEVPPG